MRLAIVWADLRKGGHSRALNGCCGTTRRKICASKSSPRNSDGRHFPITSHRGRAFVLCVWFAGCVWFAVGQLLLERIGAIISCTRAETTAWWMMRCLVLRGLVRIEFDPYYFSGLIDYYFARSRVADPCWCLYSCSYNSEKYWGTGIDAVMQYWGTGIDAVVPICMLADKCCRCR